MSTNHTQELKTYYEDTGLDYGEWSKNFNMHFGYYRFPMNPFSREPMLEAMNQQAFHELQLKEEDKVIYDLGCGLGAPSRSLAKTFSGKNIKAVTIVPWQIAQAESMNVVNDNGSVVEYVLGDYTKLPYADNSADAVYALESCCHCEGIDKAAFIKEMLRVLKPGKRFVIIDGYIKRHPDHFNKMLRYCYDAICKGWALPSFPHLGMLQDVIRENGGEVETFKDLSFRVAPSVLHAPFVVVYFLFKKMFQGEKLNPVRKGHLKACLLGLVLGMHRGSFSYGIVSGRKF